MTVALALTAARRVALAAQGFGRPVGDGPVGARQVRRVVDQVAQFQLDSVNVAVRAHYQPLFARLGGYDRALLDDAAGLPPRRLFEYWGHAASLIDVRLAPALRHRMDAARDHPWFRVAELEREHPGIVERVYDAVAERGPVTARGLDLPDDRVRRPWWNWSAAKSALEWLFMCGRVSSAGRNAQFERRYDLTERVVPPQLWGSAPDPDEARVELVRRAAAALGVATLGCLADYFRMGLPDARRAVAALVDSGELLPTPVRGWDRPTYLWHEARMPRKTRVDALVSPFDSLVFERRRLLELFGVDFRIEIYTPAAKRRYGYYVYLFVMDEAVAARVDLKADRTRGVLLVRASWLEPGCGEAETAARLAGKLREFASWLGLTDVRVEPVGTLHAALARAQAARPE